MSLTTEEVIQEEDAKRAGAKASFIGDGYDFPEKNKVGDLFRSILSKYGLSIFFQLVSLIGAAYISSIRVGYITEVSLGNMIAEMSNFSGVTPSLSSVRWAGMAAFEGALVASGLYMAKKKVLKNGQRFTNWVTYTSLTVTILAGGLASMSVIEGDLNVFGLFVLSKSSVSLGISWLFSIASSVGAPFIVAFMSENIGHLWEDITGESQRLKKQYETEVSEWNTKFQVYFIQYMRTVYGEDRRLVKSKYLKDSELSPVAVDDEERPTPTRQTTKSLPERIMEYLNDSGIFPSEVGDDEGMKIKPVIIADAIKLNPKEREQMYASLNRLRKREAEGKL